MKVTVIVHLFMLFFYAQVYGSGADVVILAPDFQRVQILPGISLDNVHVSCIDSSVDTGKVKSSFFILHVPDL